MTRAFTLGEIDALRGAVRHKVLTDNGGSMCSRLLSEETERQVRTLMMAGLTAKDIAAPIEGRANA